MPDAGKLTKNESLSLFTLSAACIAILTNVLQGDGYPLSASIAFSGLAFSATFCLIRWLGQTFMQHGLKGRDMSKLKAQEIPEAMGAVCAGVYLLVIVVFIPFMFYKDIVTATSGGGNRDNVVEMEETELDESLLRHKFPHNKLSGFLSAIVSLFFITFLGVFDDLLDIRWRHKIPVPLFASIPMLVVYMVDFNVTYISVPTVLHPYFGTLLDLGILYYIYMVCVSIFCPNAINLLAGINGLEVAQCVVIAGLIILNDILYLLPSTPYPHPATDSHLFSLYLLLPFLGVSLALLYHNWYPARVFVGDTYCYFGGMLFAVDGIMGHFSKTLLLLFIPQLINFAYSIPQLFHLVPCPRHRLPKFSRRTGLLEPSIAEFARPPHPLVKRALLFLHSLRLLHVTVDEESGELESCSNMTLINLFLVWFGPMREDRLCYALLAFQVLCGLLGLIIRHSLATLVFPSDNLNITFASMV